MKIQIDNEVREATSAEFDAIKKVQDEAIAQISAMQAAIAAKISARAKLSALGLTNDEIAALVG